MIMKAPKEVVDMRSVSVAPLTVSTAQEVVGLMVKHTLQSTPNNYTVLYRYLKQEDEALCQELDALLAKKKPFTQEMADYLYTRYCEEAVAEHGQITDQTQDATERLLNMVGSLSKQTQHYNTTLGKQTDTLSSHMEGNKALEDLLGGVVEQLKEAHSSSQKFTDELNASQQEVKQLKVNLDKMANEARYDFLTNVKNRRAFDETMIELTEQHADGESDLCLLLIDIDHFKKFNDTYGHQIGDEVLKVVAGALKRTVRGQDIVARYGGEEFAVILPETPPSGAHIVADNIRKLIAQNRLRKKGTNEELSPITISIGVSRYRGAKDDSIPEFIERSDAALYRAKDQGRNRVIMEI